MNKKAMGVGQVFVFIIAAITFSLIMIFGYRTISNFLINAEKVEFVKFKTDLESSVQKIYTEYGAVRIKQFQVPGKYEQICFVDMDTPSSPKEMADLCTKDALACSVWQDAQTKDDNGKIKGYNGVEQNVFLKPTSSTPLKVFRISLSDSDGNPLGFLCQDIHQSTFRIVLEGRGDRTEISPSPRE